MAAKAKAAVVETVADSATTTPIGALPWVLQRLTPDRKPDSPRNTDRTTALVHIWDAMRKEIWSFRQRLWQYGELQDDGSIKIIDPDGFRQAREEMDGLIARQQRAETIIKQLIEIDGSYFHELENVAYSYGNLEDHNKKRLDTLFMNLLARHRTTPEKVLEMDEYQQLKTELEKETAAGNKILAEVRAKIAAYDKALAALDE